MSNRTIFVGNGLNRLSGGAASWRTVLKKLADSAGVPEVMDNWHHKPFTLLYEQMSLGSTRKSDRQLKEKVASLVIDYKPNECHERIMNSSVSQILTTNYDYSLQLVSGKIGKSSNLRRETKYSVFRSRIANEKRIWHVHGEAEKPHTITLGYDQYSGQLQKLRGYATSDRKSSATLKSPFKQGQLDFDGRNAQKVFSWIDVFLRDDVHFVGYSLDYTELDIWWLITYKQKLRRTSSYVVGETVFHDMTGKALSDEKRAKHSILDSLGVSVELHRYRGQDRLAAYTSVLDACLG